MAVAIIIAATVIAVTAIICFKGIRIKFEKTFTIEDHRNQSRQLTTQEIEALEKKLNTTEKTPTPALTQKDVQPDEITRPMDSVIANLQDIFGPDKEVDDGRK